MIDFKKQYQMRAGRKVRLLCVDAKGTYPVIGLITNEGGNESPRTWTLEGFIDHTITDGSAPDDLVEAKPKVTIDVYKLNSGSAFMANIRHTEGRKTYIGYSHKKTIEVEID